MPAATTPKHPKALFPTPVRQAVFYILLFTVTGATLPFLPVWFKAQGMTAGQIGVILASPLLLRAVTGPLSGLWADRFALYRTPLIALSAGACVFYGLMGLGQAYGPWRFLAFLVLYTCGFSCSTSVSPLLDSMTLQLSRSEGFAYALPRAVGSVAFILADVGLGYLLLVAPSDLIVIWVVTGVALMALSGRFVLAPKARQDIGHLRGEQANMPGWQRIKVLMRHQGLFWLLLAVGSLQAAHSFYYAFSTLIWKSRGLSSSTCGYLWAVGVVAEVGFMTLGGRFRRGMGPWKMLVLAGVISVVRWGAMMTLPPVWLLWPLQALHAFTFAATYFAGLELVHRLSPKGYEGLAQTINAAYANGVMMGLGTIASGIVFERFGPSGYGLMALVALIGLGSAVRLYSLRGQWLSPIGPAPADAGSSQ